MSCTCIDDVNAKLASRNTRLTQAMMLGKADHPGLMLETEQIETGRGKQKPVSVFLSYCPFCGGKYAAVDVVEQPAVKSQESPWQWWAGSNEEWCTVGPEDSRDAIIQAATNDSLGEFENDKGGWSLGFHIVEARQDPLRLADWIDSDTILERAEDNVADSDRVSTEFEDGPWFECTPEQEKDLEERIKRACDEWQTAHALLFSCSTFSHTRNQEHVVIELPTDAVANAEGSTDA